MDIKFIHDINKNYMVLTFEKSQQDNYRIKMIRNKDIPGLLKLNQKFTDSSEKLFYDISSMQSLEVLYEKKQMEGVELKKIITGLENCVNSLKGYLLDFNDIILNPKMVFVDMKTLNYNFCYCPYGGGDFRSQLREYMNFVITKIDHCDIDTLTLAYELQKITMRENYVIGDLTALIREPILELPEEIEITIEPEPAKLSPIKEVYLNKGIIAAFVLGVLIWILIYIKTDDQVIRKMIVVIIPAALIYAGFIYYKSIKKVRSSRQTINDSPIQEEFQQDVIDEEECHTVFLGNSDYSATRFLKNTEIPERDIRLENLPLLVGKTRDRVDVVLEENSVSRIHARLTQEKSEYFIEDLNSTNGTFINGKRIVPYEKERLNTGDIVGISEIHYKFV